MEQLRLGEMRRSTQKGVVLFIALIMLVAMTIAGVALIRSVDTANSISGNISFKQASLQASDIGIEAAFDLLPTIITTSLDSNYPPGCTNNCQYYPTRQSLDTKASVSALNWSTVPAVATNLSGYTVRYVIDRLCNGPAPVTDLVGKCISEAPLGGGSKKAGAPQFSAATKVYYRVTVRVEGPKSTESFVQAVLSY